MTVFYLIIIGCTAGVLSGLLGIGGGVILIPGLVYILKFSQKLAQGTTLMMMLPPIGLFAALTYHRYGHVDIKAAVILCIAFAFSAYLSSHFITQVPDLLLKRIFGVFLLLVSIHFIFSK